MDGFQSALQALRGLAPEQQQQLLDTMAKTDPDMAARLRNELVQFEDLLGRSANQIAQLHSILPEKTWALALRNASNELMTHVLNSMPTRRGDALKESIQALGPQPLSQVQEAQAEVLRALSKLNN